MNSLPSVRIQPELFCALSDCLTDAVLALLGDGKVGSGHGLPTDGSLPVPVSEDYGLSRAVREYMAVIMATRDFGVQTALAGNAHELISRAGGWMLARNLLYKVMQDIQSAVMRSALNVRCRGMNDYATYYNTSAGPWRALVSPEFAELYSHVFKYALDPINIYAPETDLGQAEIGAAMQPLAPIDTNAYAGAGSLVAVISAYNGEPGTIVVHGSARTSSALLVPDRAWAASTNGVGEWTLAPEIAGDLCTSVSSISLPQGVQAALTVSSRRAVR